MSVAGFMYDKIQKFQCINNIKIRKKLTWLQRSYNTLHRSISYRIKGNQERSLP